MQSSLKLIRAVQLLPKRLYGSSSGSLVNLTVDDKTGYATMELNRPPVNSLNLELLQSIDKSLDQLNENRTRGLILTSSSSSVFSAGLDIMEMYKPNVERAGQFWRTLQDVWMKLFGATYPTAAAINGHSPAGGCLLAMCCEYRVMLPKFTIGLNETRLGIVAPTWFQATMLNVLSRKEAERALTLGTMFTTEEALKNGLVDETAASKQEAIEKCVAFLDQFKKVSGEARAITKQALRAEPIRVLDENRDQDVDLFLFTIQQKKVQKGLEAYLEALKKKSG
ncbi:enoyl-CoA delta isomerase 1, mitochondrial-like [Culicoides brevitarsis]|uniref:enoyl-CoA delta isomerase 1, mitochondrial-like n=1 Tax=Culicoides brevitarsis TaxID=469753 RepID=UPI00307C69A2